VSHDDDDDDDDDNDEYAEKVHEIQPEEDCREVARAGN
jgi:hypothetical protein